MTFPNKNYLSAQNKLLVQTGDTLAFLVTNLSKEVFVPQGNDKDLKKVVRVWTQAKENLMGLAGR